MIGEILEVVLDLLSTLGGICCIILGLWHRNGYMMAFGATFIITSELSGIRRKIGAKK